jgi:aspartate kinase
MLKRVSCKPIFAPLTFQFNYFSMQVFKFGGASLNSVERIQNVGHILTKYNNQPVIVITSAMGKTTNALEKVAEAFYAGNKDEALTLFQLIKDNHLTAAKFLLVTSYNKTLADLKTFFTEVEWLLHDKPVQSFDYYYDQIVCSGELLSSCIVSAYLNEKGIPNQWLDVRDIIRTDNNFREANIDWTVTRENLNGGGIENNSGMYITQGFIGSTDQNESTTLGREGSDYTAAIFANLLNADNITIWKDVEGVMSADPKLFPAASLIDELSFSEVIEMAFYGAQVIHPKTIKPLQNKKIPLHVKSFLNPSLLGTTISNKASKNLPPIIVIKTNQVLVHLQSQDFSFVEEGLMGKLYHLFAELSLKPNLIQTAAINLQVCLDDRQEKIEYLAQRASDIFDVQLEKNLTLLTIRHYTEDFLANMLKNKDLVLMQKTSETVQVLYR